MITIKKIQLDDEQQIIYLSNGDVITSQDGYGASYNNNYELRLQLAQFAMTDIDYIKTPEEIKEFKNDAINFVKYALDEIESEGEELSNIEKYKLDEFKEQFKSRKTIIY